MWSLPVEGIEPFEAAWRLRPLGGLRFLDSAVPGGANGRYSIVAAAPAALFTASLTETRFAGERLAGDPFAALDRILDRYRLPRGADDPPFAGGFVGTIDFEAAHLLERLRRPADLSNDTPLLRLALHDTVLVFDHARGTAQLHSAGVSDAIDAGADAATRRRRAEERLALFAAALAREPAPLPEPLPVAGWRSDRDADGYAAMVDDVRGSILDGEIFQANVSRTLRAAHDPAADPLALYRRLRERNPAPYAAFLEEEDRTVASCSPELFLRLRGRAVETRPIKGTARRDADPAADAAAGRALLASPKDRAENMMIVDLLRNDLSRVCEAASVAVPLLCALESFSGVHHLVSAVTGTLREGVGVGALLAATFPGGSITGAPKLQAIDIITRHERGRRSIYCGCIAAISLAGDADLSIAIRTAEFAAGEIRLGAGGGITALSVGAEEFRETETKAARMIAALAGPDAGGGP